MTVLRADRAVVQSLVKENVKYVFGLPGGHSCEILYDALHGEESVKPILTRHEESGSFEALGYAKATGSVGFCHGTAGPGWGQLLPGVHEAYAGRVPLIAFCASVPIKHYGMGALQEFPQAESMLPFCKWVYTIDKVEKVQWVMRRAFSVSRSHPPGPVFINFPIDLGGEEADFPEYRAIPSTLYEADVEAVKAAGDALLKAEAPIIVAGGGVHLSGAYRELQELAELLTIPVLTTNSGKASIPETHPLYAGGVGLNKTRASERVYEESDCALWIGSQLEEWATGQWAWRPEKAKLLYLDADPEQMSRNWIPDVALVGDAKLTLERLVEYCRSKLGKAVKSSERLRRLSRFKAMYMQEVEELRKTESKPIHPGRLAVSVSDAMPEDSIAVLGEGANRIWTATYLQVRRAGHWISSSDYGCMGFSVPASLGVKLGRPNHVVFAITGDGSFQMQMHELPVAVQYNLPVAWFVANDGALGWIKWYQREFKDGRIISVDFNPQWDFVKVAEAAKCAGMRVENPSELDDVVKEAFKVVKSGTPVVVDVLTETFQHTYGSNRYHRIGFPGKPV
ncbi:MAG: thiamine pyrophosphate-binding protein [Candidatus Bathyarchaeia archaeon]